MHHQADRLKFGRITALAGLFWLSAVGSAAAAEPCGDTSCPKGYACEEVQAGCPAIDCAPGSDCPPCQGTVLACVPEPCSSDSDCDTDMVCLEQTQTECSGSGEAPACAPGEKCDAPPPEPADCNTVTTSQCVPRWTLPCATAANCGDGFSCVEQESCGCTGSSGGSSGSGGASSGGATPPSTPGTEPAPPSSDPVPPSDPDDSGSEDRAPDPKPNPATPPGAAPAPLPPDCSCEPSGVKACVLNEVACNADSDCPSGWTCGDNPEGVCWASSDGSMGCEPSDPPKLCLPPYMNLGGGGYPTRGEDSSGGGSPTTPDTPTAPGNPGSSPSPNPLPPGVDTEEGESASNGDAESGRGCSVATGPTRGSNAPGLAALGALVALVLGRSVRTRRAAR